LIPHPHGQPPPFRAMTRFFWHSRRHNAKIITLALGSSAKRLQTMPVNVVKSYEDEIAWERAKERAREQYHDATGARFYRIVMAIYKKMTHYDERRRDER
jgi:hypothetical protein